MFTRAKDKTRLEHAIDFATIELERYAVDSEEYATILERVTRLHKLKQEETASGVSKDTLVIVGANLLGILLIIRHEHVNVITSRAMGMIVKPK